MNEEDEKPDSRAKTPEVVVFESSVLKKLEEEKANEDPADAPVTIKTENINSVMSTLLIDEESRKGRFGWSTFGSEFIPILFRQGRSYCSVRMLETKVLKKYLNHMDVEIPMECTAVKSYFVTKREAELLNEINSWHCDYGFGNVAFTLNDLLVEVTDATQFYKFIDKAYRVLSNEEPAPLDKFGFLRINNDSQMAYIVINGEKKIPIFYFEGETTTLSQAADFFLDWDLALIKLLVKIQSLRSDLYKKSRIAMIGLETVKGALSANTVYEPFWPPKEETRKFLFEQSNKALKNNSGFWTRKPLVPVNRNPMGQPRPQMGSTMMAPPLPVGNMNVGPVPIQKPKIKLQYEPVFPQPHSFPPATSTRYPWPTPTYQPNQSNTVGQMNFSVNNMMHNAYLNKEQQLASGFRTRHSLSNLPDAMPPLQPIQTTTTNPPLPSGVMKTTLLPCQMVNPPVHPSVNITNVNRVKLVKQTPRPPTTPSPTNRSGPGPGAGANTGAGTSADGEDNQENSPNSLAKKSALKRRSESKNPQNK